MTAIAINSVVEFNYISTTSDNELIEASSDVGPLVYLHGHGNIVKGLEDALLGKQVGDKFSVDVAAEDAYGTRDESLIHSVDIENFAHIEDLAPGMRLQGESEQGVVAFSVVALEDGMVTLDPNHPMAGINLKFEIEILSLRSATDDEIKHGHVHGPGGVEH